MRDEGGSGGSDHTQRHSTRVTGPVLSTSHQHVNRRGRPRPPILRMGKSRRTEAKMPAKVPRQAGVSVGLRPRRSAFSPRGRRARVCGQMCPEGAVRAGTASRLRCGVLRLPALGRRSRLRESATGPQGQPPHARQCGRRSASSRLPPLTPSLINAEQRGAGDASARGPRGLGR